MGACLFVFSLSNEIRTTCDVFKFWHGRYVEMNARAVSKTAREDLDSGDVCKNDPSWQHMGDAVNVDQRGM